MLLINKILGQLARRMPKGNFGSPTVRGCAVNLYGSKAVSKAYGTNAEKMLITDTLKIDNKNVNTTWLRENCRCHECYNPETHQRNVLFHRLNSNSFEVERLTEKGGSDGVEVLWGDNHVSCYDKVWLRSKLAKECFPLLDKKMFLWDAETIKPYMLEKKIDFEDLVNDRKVAKLACERLYQFGFVEIENAPKTMEGTTMAVNQISSIKETYLGREWEIDYVNEDTLGQSEIKDTAFTNDELGSHTDGNYLSEPPAILVWQHLMPAMEGGDLILLDGFHVANELKRLDPQAFEILTSYPVNFRYKDDSRHFIQTSTTLELSKADGNIFRIRYNHYDRSALSYEWNISTSAFYKALARLSQSFDDPKNHVQYRLQPGQILIIDNWRMLHARTAFKGRRRIVGCYMERNQWISNLLVL